MFKKKSFLKMTSIIFAALFILSAFSFIDFKQFIKNYRSNFELTIYHTNDTHAHIKNEAILASLIKQKKSQNKNVLTISSGDIISGHKVSVESKGENIIKIFNSVGYDYLSVGNHEFDFGTNNLKKLSQEANFNFLAANIKDEDDQYIFKPYDLIEMDGVKIGIFGLTTVETPTKTNFSDLDSAKNLIFLDPIDVSKEMIKELKSQGANIIISVAHMGFDADKEYRQKFVEQTKDIDLIIDAHTHTNLHNGVKINNTLIVQTGEYGENIGEVKLKLKNKKLSQNAKVIAIEKIKIKPDEKILELIDKLIPKFDMGKFICEINFGLDGSRELVRVHDTNLSNLTTDAMLHYTGADLALVNAGNFNGELYPGKVYEFNMRDVFPYSDNLELVSIKGREILKALENGVSFYPVADGSFIHAAGIKVEFDDEKKPGNRITKVTFNIDNKELELDKDYKLAINSYLLNKGDNYDIEYTTINQYEPKDLRNIVGEFLIKCTSDKTKMLNYKKVENRIIKVNKK